MPRKLSFPTSVSTLSLSSSSAGASTPTTPTASNAAASLPASLAASLAFPKLIVFDLDYTLWPFWVDTHVTPPLKMNAQHTAATDRSGEEFAFYGQVAAILQAVSRLGGGGGAGAGGKTKLAVASRTSAPGLARELLKGLHLPPPGADGDERRARKKLVALDVFDGGLEIYPGSKIRHFEALQKRTGIRFEDMLFFDDEARNKETEQLGVTMRLVRDGVTWEEIGKGVEEWRRRRMRRRG